MTFRAILIVLLISSPSFAAERSFDCEPKGKRSEWGKEAAALSAAVQQHYSGVSSLHAKFEQDSYLAALETSEASSGSVWFRKPGLMRWDYQAPEKQVFLIREHTVWYYQEAEQQLLIDKIDQMLLSDLPVSFLFGIGNLSKDFEAISVCSTEKARVLTLQPKGAGAKELQQFELLVDLNTPAPRGARVTDASGNVTAIELRDVETNAFDNDIFKADFPKGIDVSDKRKEEKSE